jgi:peptidoglycan hydrolase CwlO-like protein
MTVEELQSIQKACQEKINSNRQEQTTLKQTISTLNSKINLTQGQINQTLVEISTLENEIGILGGVLDKVNQSILDLSKIYQARVRESFRRSRVNQNLQIFGSDNFGDFLAKLKYMSTIKTKDQLILKELDNSRQDYDQRRQTKVNKQQEIEKLRKTLESQKKTLDTQQKDKQNLLSQTANDEKKFQALLTKARAELAAIESIIAGKGTESEVKDVSVGEKVASVIQGSSACSTGTHLHFEVVQNGSHQSPSSFLKSQDIQWDNQPDGSFPLTGSWDWPLNEKVRITQGYGHTAYSSRYTGDVHTGIDMNSTSNSDVKSVRNGKLFRGSIPCGGGTLKYVHVKHSDDKFDTFYLHVNYF